MNLSGKNAIVTGAGRSIGRAISLRLAKEGATVLLTYCGNKQGADETVAMIHSVGGKAFSCYADFSNAEGVKAFAEEAISRLERIDVLVNNAGVPNRSGFSVSPEELVKTYQLNTFSPFMLSQYIGDHMIEHEIEGSIVHISSIAVNFKKPSHVAYASSKAALNAITECSAMYLAEHNIRVNAVAPGVVADGMNAERLKNNPDLQNHYGSVIPLGRAGKPEDIASAVAFLASSESSWITGKIFEVDGGHGTSEIRPKKA